VGEHPLSFIPGKEGEGEKGKTTPLLRLKREGNIDHMHHPLALKPDTWEGKVRQEKRKTTHKEGEGKSAGPEEEKNRERLLSR